VVLWKIYEICVLFVSVFPSSTMSPMRFSLLAQLTLKVAYVGRSVHLVSESVLVKFIAVVLMHWEQCFLWIWMWHDCNAVWFV